MRITSLVLVSAFVMLAPAADAQTAPDSENGRYSFNQAPDGILRLDTRTGQVSLCAKQAAGWACNTVPDERAALESEITRLQRENGALKKDMVSRGLPLPSGVAGAPANQRELNLTVPLPSDAEIDRVMSAFEKMWRRLIDMVQDAGQRQDLVARGSSHVLREKPLHARHRLVALRKVDAHEAVAGAG